MECYIFFHVIATNFLDYNVLSVLEVSDKQDHGGRGLIFWLQKFTETEICHIIDSEKQILWPTKTLFLDHTNVHEEPFSWCFAARLGSFLYSYSSALTLPGCNLHNFQTGLWPSSYKTWQSVVPWIWTQVQAYNADCLCLAWQNWLCLAWQTWLLTATKEKSALNLTHRIILQTNPFCILILSLNYNFKLFFSANNCPPFIQIGTVVWQSYGEAKKIHPEIGYVLNVIKDKLNLFSIFFLVEDLKLSNFSSVD